MLKRWEKDRLQVSAKDKERECDWWGAANNYLKSAKTHLDQANFQKAGEIYEQVALCLYRAAFQVDRPEIFQMLMKAAIDAYERASDIYIRTGNYQNKAKIDRCLAESMYIQTWIAKRVSERRILFQKCCQLAEKSLCVAEHEKDKLGTLKALNSLISYLDQWLKIGVDKSTIRRILEKADRYCERAAKVYLESTNAYENARILHNIGHHHFISIFLRPFKERTEKVREKYLGYLKKAIDLFKENKQTYLWILASLDFACVAYSRITMETTKGMMNFEQIYSTAQDVKDQHLMTRASMRLSLNFWWMINLEGDIEQKKKYYDKCVEYAEKSILHSRNIGDDSGTAFAYWLRSFAELAFADEIEIQPSLRSTRLQRSIDFARKSVQYAERSGTSEAIHFAKHGLSIPLFFLAETESDTEQTSKLLKEALKTSEECVQAAMVIMPYDHWNIGINQWFQALMLLKQAEIESSQPKRKSLQKKASMQWSKGKNLIDYLALYPDAKRCWTIGTLSLRYGDSLNRLFNLTREKNLLNEIISVYTKAASMFNQVGMNHLAAQSQWQIAKTLDIEGRFSEAKTYFDQASINFEIAAKKMPLMEYWHIDSSRYMAAWREITEAKLLSNLLKQSESALHYQKAASYLKKTNKWQYLWPYYQASALLELGMFFENENNHEEAERTFRKASASFKQAEILLNARKNLAESPEEKGEITRLIKATEAKMKLLRRRLAIEKSKALEAFHEYTGRAVGLNALKDAFIRARLVAPNGFMVGEEIQIGLDLVNIGRRPGLLVRIENLLPIGFSLVEQKSLNWEGRSLKLEGKSLGALQTFSLSFRVRSTSFDAVEIRPRVIYVNYRGDFKSYDVESVLIRPLISLKSEESRKILKYLANAFRKDNTLKGMPIEKSGWRTRTQILKNIRGINKRHVYGDKGQLGKALLRLCDLGLVQNDVITGGRGRGGHITRIRIAYDKQVVREYISKRSEVTKSTYAK